MAAKLALPAGNPIGLPFFYNVSKHVGSRNANPNEADDVQLVQFLMREFLKARPGTRADLTRPSPTGVFDTSTAFWIFKIQADTLGSGKTAGAEIDGIVSPARGVIYAGDSPWLIVKLNFMLQKVAPAVWKELPNNQELRSSLRASLK